MQSSTYSASDNKFSSSNKLVLSLDLANFKILPCSIKMQHNHKQCQFFHYFKDRKRPGDFYSFDYCEYIEKDMDCPLGDKCPKSHNRVEQLYRPGKYKARFCSFFPDKVSKCEYGDFCSFAHSEQEISIDLIHLFEQDEDFFLFHYKTVMCPFNQNKHDKSLCVYAHNWQDFRRKPNEYYYEPIPCSNWKTREFVGTYDEGCRLERDCDKCHGWKEYDFHPMNWRTKACQFGANCPKKKECSCYHFLNEKREIDQIVQSKVFRMTPRNRVSYSISKFFDKNSLYSYYQANNASNFNEQDSVLSNGSHGKDNMTKSWPKVQMFEGKGTMPSAFGSDKKNQQQQEMNYNLWNQNVPTNNRDFNMQTNGSEMERINLINPSNFLSRNFSLVNKNNVGMNPTFRKANNNLTNFNPNSKNYEDDNPMSNSYNSFGMNKMSYSNPIGFRNNHNNQINLNNQNSLSNQNNLHQQNPDYALQLQEQFFKLTQFCQEKSYNPKNILNDSFGETEKNKFQEKNANEENDLDDDKLLQMTNLINNMNVVNDDNKDEQL